MLPWSHLLTHRFAKGFVTLPRSVYRGFMVEWCTTNNGGSATYIYSAPNIIRDDGGIESLKSEQDLIDHIDQYLAEGGKPRVPVDILYPAKPKTNYPYRPSARVNRVRSLKLATLR